MSGTESAQPQESSDGLLDAILRLVGWVLLVGIAAPLIVPFTARATTIMWAPTKRWYWVSYRWWWIAVFAGIAAVLALVAVEVLQIVQMVNDGRWSTLLDGPQPAAELWGLVWPWLIVNTAAGVLLLPAAWSWQRARIATRVRKRTIPDVVRQERIETAQKQAMDLSTAKRMGVKVDAVTRSIVGTSADSMTAPHQIGDRSYALGIVNKEKIRSAAQFVADRSRVPAWVSDDGQFFVLPNKPGACRLLMFSESGTGKTVALMGLILAALKMRWKVIFIDAKGVPRDARELAKLVELYGGTAVISGAGEKAQTRWNLFHGDAADITAKIMRLQPPPDGANQHYLTEIEAVLEALQHKGPLRSVQDLQERADRPGDWARDRFDHQMLMEVVDSRTGQLAVKRAAAAVAKTLRRFEEWTDPAGWSFDNPAADVTICPLIPVDPTQAALGDLLLLELRTYLKRRLEREDYSPVLVIVDEFPQLVTPGNDPADLATRLYETMRSAGGGLVLASQNPPGLSPDPQLRARALGSGAAVMFGRQKSPDELCALAGTNMRMEASGSAEGDELRSGRAQHTYRIKPDDVREAADGQFWVVQGGDHAAFRFLPNASVDATATPTGEPATAVTTPTTEEGNEKEETNV